MKLLLTGRNTISLPFDLFYHSRLADEPTGTFESLQVLWIMSNDANSVETKVLHNKTTNISRTKNK